MTWKQKYKEWFDSPNVSVDVKESLNGMDQSTRYDSFYKYLEFGTGGMRGKMGPGTNRMNALIVRRLTFSFAQYLKENPEPNKQGVVVQYDTRHHSREFAEEVAATLASQGIHVYLSDCPRPTPLLSFLVREFNAIGGIMITASHNPPEYNGYKIYNSNGCQILTDTVEKIEQIQQKIPSELVLENTSFAKKVEKGFIQVYKHEVEETYVEALFKEKLLHTRSFMDLDKITAVYSPLHGTGTSLMVKGLEELSFVQMELVKEQLSEDGWFPTVALPNPEEKEAFSMSIQAAKKKQADVVFTTDPDADRLGVAIRKYDGDYQLLTGNQLGALLIHFLLTITPPKENRVVVKTIVTSDFGAKIAKRYGCTVKETLTGFKYTGEAIQKMEPDEKEQFLFGYEESYGYLFSTMVRDKDAIQAAVLTSLAVSYYKKKQKTLVDVLEELWEEYGYYQESLEIIHFNGEEEREALQDQIEQLRKNPPSSVGEKKIIRVEDYEEGKGLDLRTMQTEELFLPQSDVLKFILEYESWFAIRLSGTEEKGKIYIGVKEKNKEKAQESIEMIKEEIFTKYLSL